ncbi:hypothetical protein [Plantibacter flavus]|uniref:hypothetical protein n=1 Tax=Plantibacter flavus TaxID=150123 RepID=UPI003397EB24
MNELKAYIEAVDFYRDGVRQSQAMRMNPVEPSVEDRLAAVDVAFDALLAAKGFTQPS